MPVRPEEKPKAPTIKVQRGMTTFPQPQTEDEHMNGHHKDGANSASYSGPVQSPLVKRTPDTRDVVVGIAEGQKKVNGHGHEPHVQTQT